MRPRAAPLALLLALAIALAGASTAGAAVVVLQDLTHPASVLELPVAGACDHAITDEESAGVVPLPCPWPAPGGDWGPPLTVRPGDTLQLSLGAPPAVAPQASLVAFGAVRRLVLGPGELTPTSPDGLTWTVTLPVTLDPLGGGLGFALVVDGSALMATLVPPRQPVARPPLPPPLAFAGAALNRARRTIDVRLRSIADVAVSVVLTRAGTRIGHGSAAVHPGRSLVHVPIGPRTWHRLSPGLHVDVRLFYGSPDPATTLGALLHRA
ncbi:hypothetical protein FSW04_00940 [Baekduia soli]|uniref:Uncharacterized protein n=1 Tax=Baekduia soli TaxID=496014 RepID=A0A5B8TZY8_9ACTN|nr:hypothetical protein [Baekduia soli]QEC46282.1 hypothetical protein FSW04_00940 [Baekduia soli]